IPVTACHQINYVERYSRCNQNHSLHSITLIRPNASTVGMPVTRHPPCSPGRAVFPHPVPRLYSHPRCKAELSGKHSSTFNLSDAGPRYLDVVEDPGKLLPSVAALLASPPVEPLERRVHGPLEKAGERAG